MVCKRCGQSVDDSVFVCEHCGTVLMSGHVVPMRKEPAMGDEPKAKTGGHKVKYCGSYPSWRSSI